MEENRTNPDELLVQVQQEERKQQRGVLKVFFGMAAGVGKTYAMQEEARAQAADEAAGCRDPCLLHAQCAASGKRQ